MYVNQFSGILSLVPRVTPPLNPLLHLFEVILFLPGREWGGGRFLSDPNSNSLTAYPVKRNVKFLDKKFKRFS